MNAAKNRRERSSLSSRSRILTIRYCARHLEHVADLPVPGERLVDADLVAVGVVEPVAVAGHARRA